MTLIALETLPNHNHRYHEKVWAIQAGTYARRSALTQLQTARNVNMVALWLIRAHMCYYLNDRINYKLYNLMYPITNVLSQEENIVIPLLVVYSRMC